MERDIDQTTLRLRLPSLTLDKHDIRELCNIVVRASSNKESSGTRFAVSKGRETVRTNSIDKLINARWPQEIDSVSLDSFDKDNIIRVLMSARSSGSNDVLISSYDSDWVTVRVKEIEDFIAEHKNWHWILHSIPWVFSFAILFAACLGAGIGMAFELSFMDSLMIGAGSFIGFFYIAIGMNNIYPFILVEANRSSTKYRLRQFINWAIPSIALGLVINLVWQIIVDLR